MDVEGMPESDLDAGCSAEGDLEGVADVGLRMALSAKLADVVIYGAGGMHTMTVNQSAVPTIS